MAVRSTMAALIARTRLLINDPAGGSQQFADQDIQDIMDEARMDFTNEPLTGRPTFTGSSIQYLSYYHSLGGWEDDVTFKQYLTVPVTPSASEPIAGHWTFATSTLPPIYATGKVFDVYRSAADLLERWSARWSMSYDIAVDGQNLRRSQSHAMLLDLAHTYRLKQRAHFITTTRTDLTNADANQALSLGATALDYMASGNGS